MGLICSILQSKDIGNCSNHGISEQFDCVTLTGYGGPFDPAEDRPEVQIKSKNVMGHEYHYAVPVNGKKDGHAGWMMGGCFIYTSDSRFRATFTYPVPLHDRQESPQLNKILSR